MESRYNFSRGYPLAPPAPAAAAAAAARTVVAPHVGPTSWLREVTLDVRRRPLGNLRSCLGSRVRRGRAVNTSPSSFISLLLPGRDGNNGRTLNERKEPRPPLLVWMPDLFRGGY
ncbi:hypothetical protein E2C01_041369 [Portunus trituberculatus]|uniref:Uncharacterized protein n=1 Tax=Portunus trituberculatus TaxID=210409 RepID=A0A5B7FQS8_PORTR|nr:hypothetical protein [Portunus trituberculatus]